MGLEKNGAFKLAGSLNLKLKSKPATPARKGVNPFTKEPCVFKAKPASKTEFEVFAPLDWFHGDVLLLVLAVGGLHLQHNLFGGLGFFVKDRLGLTTITALLSVISPSTLAEWGFFAFLVLGHLEVLVLPGGRAVGFSGFWDVYHFPSFCKFDLRL